MAEIYENDGIEPRLRVVTHTPEERAVLKRALWRAACHAVGEQFDDLLFNPTTVEDVAEIDRRIAALLAARQAIQILEVDDGGEYDIPVSAQLLASDVRDVVTAIAEDEGFWKLTPQRRAEMMAQHDAGRALAERITEFEAVA